MRKIGAKIWWLCGRHTRAIILFVLTFLVMGTLVATAVMQPPHAAALTVGLLVLILTVIYVEDGSNFVWRTRESARRAGARDETSELAWMLFGRDSNISYGGRRYITAVANRVVATRGLTLTEPADFDAVVELLGAPAVAALLHADKALDLKAVHSVVTALENCLPDDSARENFPLQNSVTRPDQRNLNV